MQGAAHDGNQALADGQAQPGAAKAPRGGRLCLREAAKNFVLVLRGNTNARVFNGKAQAVWWHTHGGVCRHGANGNNHLPLGRKFDGVAAQVDQNLLQAQGVAPQHVGYGGVNVKQHFNRFVAQVGRQHDRQVAQQAVHTEGLHVQVHLAGFYLGKIQNVVEQAQERARSAFGFAGVVGLAIVQRCFLQQGQHAQNGVHGGANFVAHIGQKLPFAARRFFGHRTGRLQLGLVGFGGRNVVADRYKFGDFAFRIDKRRNHGVYPIQVPVFGAVAHLATPRLATGNGEPHGVPKLGWVGTRVDDAVVGTNQLLAAVAANGFKRVVNAGDGARAVGLRNNAVGGDRGHERGGFHEGHAQGFGGAFLGGNVGFNGHYAAGCTGRVAQNLNVCVYPIVFAVAFGVVHLQAYIEPGLQRLQHGGVGHRVGVLAIAQVQQFLALGFIQCETGDAGKGRVGPFNVALGVGNDHGIVGAVHHGGHALVFSRHDQCPSLCQRAALG